jgi:hypothetical protein
MLGRVTNRKSIRRSCLWLHVGIRHIRENKESKNRGVVASNSLVERLGNEAGIILLGKIGYIPNFISQILLSYLFRFVLAETLSLIFVIIFL